MNLDPVEALLAEAGLPRIGQTGSLVSLRERPPQFFPATIILPDRETPQTPARRTGIYDQDVLVDFMVAVLVGGSMTEDRIEAERRRLAALVEDAVIGWVHPDAGGTATQYQGARLLPVDGRGLGWGMVFRTRRRIRKQIDAKAT